MFRPKVQELLNIDKENSTKSKLEILKKLRSAFWQAHEKWDLVEVIL